MNEAEKRYDDGEVASKTHRNRNYKRRKSKSTGMEDSLFNPIRDGKTADHFDDPATFKSHMRTKSQVIAIETIRRENTDMRVFV